MEITFLGVIELAIGAAILLFGTLRAAFILLIVSGLLSGSAVIALPGLGGSTIPPFHFALMFVLLRILMPGGGYIGAVPGAIKENRWFLLFAFYGIAGAFILPRMFAGVINVYPMNFESPVGLFDTIPLQPTSQNITQAFYLGGSLLAGITAYIFGRTRGAGHTLVSVSIWVGWLHIIIGLVAVAVRGTPADTFLDLFRNGNYVQMDDEVGGFVRIRGIFPEASAYSIFAFSYFVLCAELWYRSIRATATGWLTFALAVVLFFSTSSTAYVGLAAYLLFFALRVLVFPRLADMSKVMKLMAGMGGMAFVSALVLALVPDLPDEFLKLVEEMTVGKGDSDSGRQRLFWAMQGWWVFIESYGIGIGVGSFRSSSMLTAMLGSIGAIGVISFLLFAFQFLQPWKKSTWGGRTTEDKAMASAFASAALLSLIPAAVSSAEAYPGVFFAVLAGTALALRPARDEMIYYAEDEEEPEDAAHLEPVQKMAGTAAPTD